jgi:hypothetical protein
MDVDYTGGQIDELKSAAMQGKELAPKSITAKAVSGNTTERKEQSIAEASERIEKTSVIDKNSIKISATSGNSGGPTKPISAVSTVVKNSKRQPIKGYKK